MLRLVFGISSHHDLSETLLWPYHRVYRHGGIWREVPPRTTGPNRKDVFVVDPCSFPTPPFALLCLDV